MKLLLALLLTQAIPFTLPPTMHATVTVEPMAYGPAYVPFDGPVRAVLVTHCPNGYRVTVSRMNGTHFSRDFTGQKTDIFLEMK